MIGQGLTVSEIAAELSLSVKTVKSLSGTHPREDADAHERAELMRYVIRTRPGPGRPPDSGRTRRLPRQGEVGRHRDGELRRRAAYPDGFEFPLLHRRSPPDSTSESTA